MSQIDTIITNLRGHGERITKVRRAMLEIFLKDDGPLSVEEMGNWLKKKHLMVNKTTLYREVDFLLDHELIRSVYVGLDRKRYELALGNHHHHVVCRDCGAVREVEVRAVEKTLDRFEKGLAQKINFYQVKHSLEFFGLCRTCHKKQPK